MGYYFFLFTLIRFMVTVFSIKKIFLKIRGVNKSPLFRFNGCWKGSIKLFLSGFVYLQTMAVR